MSDSTYHVVVTREDDEWLADVPGVTGAHTFARNLEALEGYVREVIALALDLPQKAETSLQLAWDYRTGDEDLDQELAALRAKRKSLDGQRAVMEQQTVAFARRLGAQFSVRDLAALLGVSRARAQQLLHPLLPHLDSNQKPAG